MDAGSAFLQPIRDSEFLNSIKLRSAIPGGTCEFDLPEYFCWLSQPAEARMRAFGQWLGLLRPLCDAIAELLWLTRQAGRSRQEIAKGGVFMIGFDRDAPAQLLRIALPAQDGLFPEISGGGQHRCNVRFLKWNGLNARAAPDRRGCAVYTDHLRLRAPHASHSEVPDLRAQHRMVGSVAVSAVLQRALPDH